MFPKKSLKRKLSVVKIIWEGRKVKYRMNNLVKKWGRNLLSKSNREAGIRFWINQELNNIKVVFPADYFQKTADFTKNMALYEEALKEIKAAYAYHLVDFVPTSREDLVRRKIKQESYCQRHNLNREDLTIIEQVVKERIEAQARLAQIYALLRDDNCTISELKEAIRLEEKLGVNGDFDLNQHLAAAQTHYDEVNKGQVIKILCRNRAKSTLTYGVMFDIKFNVGLTDKKNSRSKDQINWTKKLDLLKRELASNNIFLDKRFEVSPKHEEVLFQTWQEISEKEGGFTLSSGESGRFKPSILQDLARRHPDPKFKSQSVLRYMDQKTFSKALDNYSREESRDR